MNSLAESHCGALALVRRTSQALSRPEQHREERPFSSVFHHFAELLFMIKGFAIGTDLHLGFFSVRVNLGFVRD